MATPGPVGGALPFAGTPYAQNQLAAQAAYERALSNLSTQRNQIMSQYGFNPQTGQAQYNPTSLYGQLSHSIEGMEDTAQNNILARGLSTTSGLGAQAADAANYQRDLALNNFGNRYQGALSKVNAGLLTAEQSYQNQTVNNRLALIQFLLKHGQFTPAKRGA